MGEDINGYLLTDELTTVNAGMCRWGFAQKEGHEYFIKEFLSPKYPLDESKLGPELTKKMRDSAESFYIKKCCFYNSLSRCRNGNNMIILDFFRNGAKYYAVSDKVGGNTLTVSDVAKMPDEYKYTLVRSILYSISKLHEVGIVHSDLRPENIIIKTTYSGYCTAKVIDFDSGFFEADNPDRIEGSQNYFSPEAIQKMNHNGIRVTTKADVWALGLLIHQYWCGRMPMYSEEFHYAGEAIINGGELIIEKSIPLDIRRLIERMLAKEPDNRPTVKEAWESLRERTDKAGPNVHEERPIVPLGWSVPDDLG